ncbi:MAG TPA: oligosaccharide flippase family protein [Nocardioides sp.]|nr:oligosaccharide flippase family protein [Nocardioides sp.]
MTGELPTAAALRRTGATAATLAASEIVGKAATLVMFLLMARMLGVAQFGTLSLGFGLGLLVAIVSSLGLDARLIQLGSAQPELLERCYGALLGIRALLCTVICAVTVPILFRTMDRADAEAVMFIGLACLIDTFSDVARACCGARQAQHRTAVVLVAQRFGAAALVGGALVVDARAWVAALAYLVATAGGAVGMYAAAARVGVRPQFARSLPAARQIVRAAPVMGLNDIASMGLARIDTALIAAMVGTSAVGVYSANYRIFETVLFVSWTLSRAFVPVVASDADDPAQVRFWSQRAMLTMLAIYVPYGVVLGTRGDDLVGALVGPEYVEPGLVAALALAPVLFGVAHLCGSVLLAIQPDPVVLVASVLALVVNVGLNLLLIPALGIHGAAVATTLAFTVQASVLLTTLQRRTGRLVVLRQLAGILLGSAAAALVCGVIGAVLLALALAAVAYLVVLVLVTRLVDPAFTAEICRIGMSGSAEEAAVPSERTAC